MQDPQIGKAIALVHRDPAAAWSVQKLAAAVGMSRSGFAARFKEVAGQSPLQYVTRWRMLLAASRLQESDMTLAELSERLGYRIRGGVQPCLQAGDGGVAGENAAGATQRARASVKCGDEAFKGNAEAASCAGAGNTAIRMASKNKNCSSLKPRRSRRSQRPRWWRPILATGRPLPRNT